MSDAPLRVFLSYARADSASFVDKLEIDLKKYQFHPWVDRRRLESGEEWMEMLQDAIDQCQALVVVLSPAAVQSRYVRMEYRYASSIGKLVIPALHLPVIRTPIDLHLLQWANFHASYEEGLSQLVQALSHHLPLGVAAPAPAKTREDWLREGDALIHYKVKRYAEALSCYEHALELDPTFARALCGKAEALNELDRYEEALAAAQRAIQLDPQDARAHRNKGYALWGVKRPEEALISYERAIQLNQQYAPAYNGKGNVLCELKRYEEALPALERAIQLDPQYVHAYTNKGLALHHLKRYEEVLPAFERAIQLDPQSSDAYCNKGVALHDLKRYEGALAAFERALQLDPSNATCYAWKSESLKALGRMAEAEQAYQRARELGT